MNIYVFSATNLLNERNTLINPSKITDNLWNVSKRAPEYIQRDVIQDFKFSIFLNRSYVIIGQYKQADDHTENLRTTKKRRHDAKSERPPVKKTCARLFTPRHLVQSNSFVLLLSLSEQVANEERKLLYIDSQW